MPRGIGNGFDTYADSTLMTFSKKELIQTIRLLEQNLRGAKEVNDRQYKMLVDCDKCAQSFCGMCIHNPSMAGCYEEA